MFRVFHMLLEVYNRRRIVTCFELPVTCAFRMISPKKLLRTHQCGSLLVPQFPLTEFKLRVTMPTRLKSFLYLWHKFCFSCQQFCPSSVCCRLWVLPFWWSCPFCVLSSSKDKEEQRLAVSGANGGVHGSQSFEVCCHWWKSFPCWYPSAVSFWESGKFLLKQGVQARLQEFSRRFCELCVVDCCRAFCDRPRVQLFLPPILVGGDDHARMQLFDMLLDGLLEKGWGRGAKMEANKPE